MNIHCSQFEIIAGSAAMNIRWACLLLDIYTCLWLVCLRVKWGGRRLTYMHMVGFNRYCPIDLQCGHMYQCTFLPSVVHEILFCPVPLTILDTDFSTFAILTMCPCGFSLHLADDQCCWAPFYIFAGPVDRLFCNTPVPVFSPFFYWVVCLCIVEILYVFYILIRTLCQIIYKVTYLLSLCGLSSHSRS